MSNGILSAVGETATMTREGPPFLWGFLFLFPLLPSQQAEHEGRVLGKSLGAKDVRPALLLHVWPCSTEWVLGQQEAGKWCWWDLGKGEALGQQGEEELGM